MVKKSTLLLTGPGNAEYPDLHHEFQVGDMQQGITTSVLRMSPSLYEINHAQGRKTPSRCGSGDHATRNI